MDYITSFSTTAYGALKTIASIGKPKKVILDPLTTVARLAVLSHKPKGTKIGIYKHQIIYFEPTMYQGIARTYYRDKRSDLHNLEQPIKKASEWYPKDSCKEFECIFAAAHKGLIMLKDNYDAACINPDKSTYFTLTIYDNILTGRQPDIHDSITPERAQSLLKDNNNTDNLIHSKLRQLWSESDIAILYNFIVIINSSDDEVVKQKNIKNLEDFLKTKEEKVADIVKMYTTTL